MKTFKGLLVAGVTALALVGCGGGGGGDGVTNPLTKYAGSYYVCDGRERQTVTVTAAGVDSLQISYREDIYSNVGCTGTVVGTYVLSQPAVATYQGQTTINMPPVTVLPTSATVDRVSLSMPAQTAQLSGSGVSGSCVNYTNGKVCYDSLSISATSEAGAVYQTGNYLVTFVSINNVLTAEDIVSKDITFNISSLVGR